MLNAGARSPRRIRGSRGSCSGTNDLVKDLGAAQTPDRLPLIASLGLCLLAARAEGLVCVDGVYNAFQDDEGLRAACVQGRDMGFDGKTLIHPDQLAVANEVFAPSADDLALAETQVAAFEEAEARGEGVAVVERPDRREPARRDRPAPAGAGRGHRARWRRAPMTLLVLGLAPLDRWPTCSSAARPDARAGWPPRWAPARRGASIAAADRLGLVLIDHRLPRRAVRAGLRPAVLGHPPQQPDDAGRGRAASAPATPRAGARTWLRHPMLTGVVVWALAHLLVNGDLASLRAVRLAGPLGAGRDGADQRPRAGLGPARPPGTDRRRHPRSRSSSPLVAFAVDRHRSTPGSATGPSRR